MPTLTELLLAEFDQEMATTERVLRAVPEATFGWQPHAKSMRMDRLAGHVAVLPSWITDALTRDTMDVAPDNPEADNLRFVPASAAAMLERFERSVRQARADLAACDDARLEQPWTMTFRGQAIFTEPRRSIVRTWVLNHLIHHRAQLGVYLRLNDVPVPSVYGPTADAPVA